MKPEERIIIEWGILISLFKATIEQQSMLIGQTKRDAKMIFNRWDKEGNKLMKIIEKETDMEQLEAVSDVIHNAVHKIRKANGI